MGEQTVAAGYDRIADQYLTTKQADDPIVLAALERLADGLPPTASVLDLGCGAGVPATRWLAHRFPTTGVDVSARQIGLARQHVPQATLIRASMLEVAFAPAQFAAVVALYSIIHVPRDTQPLLLRRIHDWLTPGGLFLATWAIQAWEGTEENWEGWGAPMWWSHHDAATNLTLIRETGFTVVSAEERASGAETWLWVLAQRPPSRRTDQNLYGG